jgi:c(7)-type cytochrome triheme protein
MKLKALILLVVVIMLPSLLVYAVPPGKTLEFTKSPMGKVIFDGTVHAKAVSSCKDCHKADLFPKMKKGTVSIKMNDMYGGKYCGSCHNGKVSFNLTQNCGKCHKK